MKETGILIYLLFAICFYKIYAEDVRYFCDGQCDVIRTRCSCMDSCKEEKNCCTDYEETCNGRSSWKDTECTPADEMTCPEGYQNRPILVILSIDAFRASYIHRDLTPTISKLGSCGVKTPYMRSVFPTKTFPNHYSIVTGLYPESHGIISNTIYDHDRKEKFRLGKPSSFVSHWWRGEPIWVTASNQRIKSATYYWPGSEINITRYPDYYFEYNQSTPLEERVYQLFDWLDMPGDERPTMIALYNHVVDTAGHRGGPFGPYINNSLVKSDNMVEMIMNGLRDRNLDTCVNFMITSDHGMASVDCENKITFLENYIEVDEYTTDQGPFVRIGKSFNESLSSVYDPVALKKDLECMEEDTHFQAYLKYEYLPKRFHYANNENIEDLNLLVNDEAWVATSRSDPDCKAGGHGYDNTFEDMRAFFAAHGPVFKRGYDRSEPFENIELYNLMTELLDLNPAPNNGTLGSLHDILKNPPKIRTESFGVDLDVCTPNANKSMRYVNCAECQVKLPPYERNRSVTPFGKAHSESHMLYGNPRIVRKNAQFCMLVNADYTSTYSHDYTFPVISSFVLSRMNYTQTKETPCPKEDFRLEPESNSVMCRNDKRNITWIYLFHPSLESTSLFDDVVISSNRVPVYRPFTQIWDFMIQSLQKWAKLFNGISVHVGPIFDYDYDGHADSDEVIHRLGVFHFNIEKTLSVPIPTHYFLVVTKCRNQSEKSVIKKCAENLDNIEVLSFIIPNYKETPCHKNEALNLWIPQVLSQHIARIKDVELLTEITFFTSWLTGDSVTRKDITTALRKKVLLPNFPGDWFDESDNSQTEIPPTAATENTPSTTSSVVFNTPYFTVLFISLLVAIYAFKPNLELQCT